ncbi:MAG: hypothetical protein GYA55_09875 [SAR324 cluster bacterium]|uniref:Uncharacterized protein n=1 Tax=SAR324 cluster bacterium TaxID=2024889 RepID=A0A7X9FTD6_9DELT|nr:hypothetical protein [SAR324 cluster bacterium]
MMNDSKGNKEKNDRIATENFLKFYCKQLRITSDHPYFPEDHESTPSDSRIDAIYHFDGSEMHVEHTSVDLIASGRTNKRTLDAAFFLVEEELKKIACPAHKGVHVQLRLDYARNAASLKNVAPQLRKEVERYIDETDSREWEKYPRLSDCITISGLDFFVRPDILKGNQVSLQWLATDANFLDENRVEKNIEKLVRTKLSKLDASLRRSSNRCYGLLLIETSDIAAKSLQSFCGVFARLVAVFPTLCSEIWGCLEGTDPVLIWFEDLDRGRVDCAYSDNRTEKTYAEIKAERMRVWEASRRQWLERYMRVAPEKGFKGNKSEEPFGTIYNGD